MTFRDLSRPGAETQVVIGATGKLRVWMMAEGGLYDYTVLERTVKIECAQ